MCAAWTTVRGAHLLVEGRGLRRHREGLGGQPEVGLEGRNALGGGRETLLL